MAVSAVPAGQEVGRIVVDDRMERIDRVLAHEGPLSRHQLEENRAEREQIRPRIDRITLDLLGCQITGGAKDDPGERRETAWQCGILRELRDAEVQDLRGAGLGQEDVLGLEIAMDQPARVRGHQAARQGGGDAAGVGRGDRPSADRRSQGLAVEQFRDQVRATVRHPHVEHLDDVGVVERCGDPRFLQEPLDRVPIAAFRAGQRLERDVSTEPRIGRPVDVSHSATSQQRHDPVRSDRGAFRERGLVLRQIPGGEDQGRRFEKPVDRSTGGGELVGHLQQLRVLGGEGGSQLRRADPWARPATCCASPRGRAIARCS